MSYLSIHSLPPKLETVIVREAKRRHVTKTQIVIQALEQAFKLDSKTGRTRDVHSFFGKMTRAEFNRFRQVTRPFSQIDPELWQ